MIGYYGEIVFMASSERIFTPEEISINRSARYNQHAVITDKPLIEFNGRNATQVTFSIFISSGLGVDARTEIDQLISYMESGISSPLMLGDRVIGNYVLTGFTETERNFDREGNLVDARVSLQLLEA